jgi:hypothetical protein
MLNQPWLLIVFRVPTRTAMLAVSTLLVDLSFVTSKFSYSSIPRRRRATSDLSQLTRFVKVRMVDRQVTYSECKQKVMLLRGRASSAKMMLPRNKQSALACHPTRKYTELNNLSINR